MSDSRIITGDLSRNFQEARAGLPMRKVASIEGPKTIKAPRIRKEAAALSQYAQHMQQKLANFAAAGAMGGGFAGGAGANIATSSPEIRNPLLNLINFYLPYDRKTLNQWIRYYDRFQPYIGNCLDIHGEFPISDFHFTKIEDAQVVQMYEEIKESCNVLEYLYGASREYELLGECYAFWRWSGDKDDEDTKPEDYTIINPDLLDVMSFNFGSSSKMAFAYEPEEELKELIRNHDSLAEGLLETVDPVLRQALEAGQKIPLDEFNVMAMVRKASPYDSRGTSIVLRTLKELMYEDKLREAQYAIADQQITPVQLWKLGNVAGGYMPSDQELEDLRALILGSRHDPLFTIISHDALSLDLIGYTGKLLPVIPEFEWVAKRVMVGLFTNESMLTGEGPTYSNAVIALKILQGRYQLKRDKFVKNLTNKLWRPLAQARKIYRSVPADANGRIRTSRRELMVPGMEWNFKLDLTDQAQRMQYIMQLRDKTMVPMKVLCEILNLDFETTKNLLKAEEGTPFDPKYQKNRMDAQDAAPDMSGGGGAAPPPDAGGTEGGTSDAEAPAGDEGAAPAAGGEGGEAT